jgi:hypothetical protein
MIKVTLNQASIDVTEPHSTSHRQGRGYEKTNDNLKHSVNDNPKHSVIPTCRPPFIYIERRL